MNYEDDMYIDENALDYEFLEQPVLMARYSRLLAEAQRDRDLAKESLDLVKAQISSDIRDDPNKYDLEKITVDAVNSCVLQEKDYQTARQKVTDTEYEVSVLFGVISAINHRKSSLENLAKLHGQNYFAGPQVPHDLTELREERKKERDHRVGQSMKRTKKSK